MKKWLTVALAALLCLGTAHATVLSGTFHNPDGTGFNGRLTIQLQRNGVRNTCVTPSLVVPTAPVTVQITNGSTQSSPNIVPSDCMSVFATYLTRLIDSTGSVKFNGQLYVTQAGGSVVSPSGGSIWIVPSGLAAASDGNQVAFFVSQFTGGYQQATALTGSVANGATPTISVTWPTAFLTTSYATTCGVLDGTAPTNPTLSVSSISNVTTTGVSVTLANSSTTRSGTIICRGRLN